jgi:hypothetical protein
MSSIKSDFLKLSSCQIKTNEKCSYPKPTRNDIMKLAEQINIPQNIISNIFNSIEKSGNSIGGARRRDTRAAAEPSDDEEEDTDESSDDETDESSDDETDESSDDESDVSSDDETDDETNIVSESGLTQGQQDNMVNTIMVAISILITVGGLTTGAYNLSAIEEYLYNNGIVEPLCKGILDRAKIIGLRHIDPSLGGSDCSVRTEAAKEFIKKIASWFVTIQGTLTAGNWTIGHKLIKDKIFGVMSDQSRITRRNRRMKIKAKAKKVIAKAKSKTKTKNKKDKAKVKKDKAKTKKVIAKAKAKTKKANAKAKSKKAKSNVNNSISRSRSTPPPNSTMNSTRRNSRSRSRSNSGSRSRSNSGSRSRSNSGSGSRSRSNSGSRSRS